MDLLAQLEQIFRNKKNWFNQSTFPNLNGFGYRLTSGFWFQCGNWCHIDSMNDSGFWSVCGLKEVFDLSLVN